MSRSVVLACLLFALAPVVASAAEPAGITLTEHGQVMVKADHVEIEAQAVGAAEMSKDATVKHRATLRSALDSLKKMELAGLRVEQRGISVGTETPGGNNAMAIAMRMGGNATPAKSQFKVASKIRVTLAGTAGLSEQQLTDALSRILDAIKDSGATVESPSANLMAAMVSQQGMTTVVRFVVDDARTARDRAFEQAFKKARERAERWAKAAGVSLGGIISLEDLGDRAEPTSPQEAMMAMYSAQVRQAKNPLRLVSDDSAEIPVDVTIKVRFAIKERSP